MYKRPKRNIKAEIASKKIHDKLLPHLKGFYEQHPEAEMDEERIHSLIGSGVQHIKWGKKHDANALLQLEELNEKDINDFSAHIAELGTKLITNKDESKEELKNLIKHTLH